ncbi:hypothetical protein [Hyunsoonleella pacifica]|uniref:Uncharacterized protein n=1 Tax=Hyunsoonleella pacifica TaxID=1080224 RepID=A0A4Q9FPJ9_9FLAO|nr:hypothetical protein [Hyunsoonleella pacifica]TBN16362.1 hypothetical protein EYD46_06875 [Hyunsoonleella pacifica]GGD20096.1 hypothetical protein GCM10011368_22480 [Hyunsoonleella pacifica]
MSIFDRFFFILFQYYKKKNGKKAIRFATLYVSILQCSFLLLLGVFFAGFFKQMHVDTMSASKAWTLFILISVALFFKNWMQYSGKKRNMLNAKRLQQKKQAYSIGLLFILPFIVLGLAYVLSHAI